MAGVRIKSIQAAMPMLDEQFDRMLFVVDLAQPDTTLCLTGAELKTAVGLKEHTRPLEDVDGLVGELEKKLDKEGVTIYKKTPLGEIGWQLCSNIAFIELYKNNSSPTSYFINMMP